MALETTTLDRKSLKRPDEFMSVVHGFFDSLARHTRGVITAIVILLAVSGGLAFYLTHREAKMDSAQNALYMANKAYQAEFKALAAAASATSKNDKDAADEPAQDSTKDSIKDSKNPKASKAAMDEMKEAHAREFAHFDVDAKLGSSVQKFKAVIQEFDGTRAAFEARMQLGNLYLNHGEVIKALPFFEQAEHSAPNRLERAYALFSVGYAQEALGKLNEAAQTFQSALQFAEAALAQELLMSMARVQTGLHDFDKARSIYDQVVAQFPQSENARLAMAYKANLH